MNIFLLVAAGLLASSCITALPQQPDRVSRGEALRKNLPDNCADIPGWILTDRIVGGQPAQEAIPWQVSIRSCPTGNCHYCGGTILDERTVLTAAHCYEAHGTMDGHFVMAGSKGRSDRSGQTIAIESIVRNDDLPFDSGTLNNDYLILKLKTAFDLNNANVQRACLPDASYAPKVGEICYVSGWGKLKYGRGSLPEVLHWVRIPIENDDVCSNKYQGLNEITNAMICAGYEQGGKDSCQSDSGGPLICLFNGKATLAGVVSWGIGCGTPGFPGVYARVSRVREWIDENLENGGVFECPQKINAWWGDKYCDDFMNTLECGFDGGDCCQTDSSPSGWNSYCSKCICHLRPRCGAGEELQDIWRERKCKKKLGKDKCDKPRVRSNCQKTCAPAGC